MKYVPDWVDGKEVGKGRRDAACRYQAIAEYLADKKVDKVLDFGAYNGYFSQRLVEDFSAEVTAVDDSPLLRAAPGVTAIRERLTSTQIRKLGPFDAALCLSVLHHAPQWRTVLKALLAVAPIVFVETAHPDEVLPKAIAHSSSDKIRDAMESAGGVELRQTPGYDARFSRPLWVIDKS